MTQTQVRWSISPRIGEFTREIIPLEEVQTFYQLDQVTVPEDRPYTWSNTVATLDGVIGYIILKFVWQIISLIMKIILNSNSRDLTR